jgi:hypothetical protein
VIIKNCRRGKRQRRKHKREKADLTEDQKRIKIGGGRKESEGHEEIKN